MTKLSLRNVRKSFDGKVVLHDGSVVLGVLGEPFLCEGQREITSFGSWRAYTAAQQIQSDNNEEEQ